MATSLIRSSTVMILNAVKHIAKKSNDKDFRILLLNRIVNTGSYANEVVFPGGLLDSSDSNESWNDIIVKYFSEQQLQSLCCGNRKSVYEGSMQISSMMPEIFYRICAIRETFEETGVLLAVDRNRLKVTEEMTKSIINAGWQTKVSSDPSSFNRLFKEMDLCPDLLSLSEWSLWITPTKYRKRFRTVFFVHSSGNEFQLHPDEEEAESAYWQTPVDTMRLFHEGKCPLAPPQVSEMIFIASLSWPQFVRQVTLRHIREIQLNYLMRTHLKDGEIFIMPGDCRYPTDSFIDVNLDLKLTHLSREEVIQDKCVRRMFRLEDGSIKFQFTANEALE